MTKPTHAAPPRRRRPSLAASVADLRRAGLTVRSARITVDGEYVIDFADAAAQVANPWDAL